MKFVWKKADFDATMGVFFDGFTKVLIAVGALSGVLAKDQLFGRVMSGLAISLFALHVFLWFYGEQMKKKTGDESFVAIPGGVSAYRFFIYLFAIFFVLLDQVGPEMALEVTILANVVGSIIFIAGAWFVPLLMKVLPAESIFAALAGASLAFLGINVFHNSITTMPIIGLITTFIVLFIYLGNVKTKLPAVLIAMLVGVLLGWGGVVLGFTPESILSVETLNSAFDTFGLYLPTIAVSFLSSEAFRLILPFLPLIIAFAIGDVVNVILGLQQAKAVGHDYSDKKVIVGFGIFSLLSAFLGNPFPFTIFFGYNTWKEINAGTAYSLSTGLIYLVLGLTGSFAIIASIIPTAAVGGILIFIAIVSTGQTFESSNKKYFPAIAFALMLPIIEVITTIIGPSVMDIAPGLVPLAQGATLTAIILSAALIFATDNKWKACSAALAAACLMAFFGLIHAPQIAIFANPEYVATYAILSVGTFVYSLAVKENKSE